MFGICLVFVRYCFGTASVLLRYSIPLSRTSPEQDTKKIRRRQGQEPEDSQTKLYYYRIGGTGCTVNDFLWKLPFRFLTYILT